MKELALLAFSAGILFGSSSYADVRLMLTPSERLVGHWSTSEGDNLYYANVKSDGVGSYTLVQPDGNTALHQYKIISQIPSGERMIVQLLFSDDSKRNETYFISKDGMRLESTTEIIGMTISSSLKYIDNKVKP